MPAKLEIAGRIEALSLNLTDIVVVTLKEEMAHQDYEYFLTGIREMFPENRIVILPPGASLSTVTSAL